MEIVTASPASDGITNWKMDAKITMRQVDAEQVEELHYVLTVSNKDWSYNLQKGAMLQTYIQILDNLTLITEGRVKYENFVQTLRFIPEDNGQINEKSYFYNASCGEEMLSMLSNTTFAGVESPEKSSCGFYLSNIGEMSIDNT